MRTQHIAQAILLSTIVVSLTGCQVFSPVGDFISQRYTNVASYFNTYYNAQKAFSDAENEVRAGLEAGRDKNARGQASTPAVSSAARQKFTASIEKNSKLLSYYPNSKYVDDALLMIGKAYFYLEDDLKAERKFLELIAQFPESNLIPEAKLWYGRTLLRQKKTAEGIQQLSALYTKALEDGDDDVAGGAALALGTYYFGQNDYANALKFYTNSIDVLGDDKENARTQFQIGLCYSNLGDFHAAEQAFRDVSKFDPDFSTQFQAALYESRMLTQQKQYEPALELLNDKLDDAKYRDYFATAHREIGNTYAAEGRVADAVAKYRYVDTAFARTDDAARSMFALASLYEHELLQFDSARVYYDKARTEYSASEITPAAVQKSESFGKYFSLKREIAQYDTLIRDLTTPGWRKDSVGAARVDSLRRADSAAAASRTERLRSLMQTRMPKDTAARAADTAGAVSRVTVAPGDTGSARQRAMPAAVELSPEVLDSLRQADSTALVMRDLQDRQKADSLARQMVRAKFELGGVLYLELNRPDSALVYYHDVIRTTRDSILAARTYFTMADLYRTQDSTAHGTIDSLYRKIIEVAPVSSYAQEARRNLGLPVEHQVADSSEAGYLEAEKLMAAGKSADAIPVLRSVASGFPKSPYAPKALYAIGWIFENTIVDNDSADAAYARLAKAYPASQYTAAVLPKLNEVEAMKREEERKAKEEKAKADAEAEQKRVKEKTGAASSDSLLLQQRVPTGSSAPGDSLQRRMMQDRLKMKPQPADTSRALKPGDTARTPARDSSSVRPRRDSANVTAPPDTMRGGKRRNREQQE